MSVDVTVDRRFKISDPKPAYCSACGCGATAELTFFDLNAAFDAGAFVTEENLTYVQGSDDLHLCESCVQQLMELSGYRPSYHRKQIEENRFLRTQMEHWRDTARDLKRQLDRQLNINLGVDPNPPRRK